MQRTLKSVFVVGTLMLGIAVHAQDAVELRYGLWEAPQLAPYQACADAFTQEHPNITIKIEQAGWGDYWTNIQTGFAAGNAPDVFTDHLAKYPEFANQDLLVDIQPLVERDNVPTDIYIGGLADLWMRDGKRYGLPKDWDTIAVAYNPAMFEAAGIDEEITKTWTWNAQDGGDFGKAIAELTLDANGNNGLSPDFDKDNVVQYGFIPAGSGGAAGQQQWSHWAVSNGFKFTDGPWSSKYYYDDPKLAETLQWYADLHLVKGYAPGLDEVTNLGEIALLLSGQGAMTTIGSWTLSGFVDTETPIKFALLPIGPEGRKSMFNGLADSIWVGSQHQEEAWEWVKFLASPACQSIVGDSGVVFPAIQTAAEASLKMRADNGIDVSAFTTEAFDPEGTFLFPIADHASEVNAIIDPAIQSIMLGEITAAEALAEANQEVNELFEE
jgi:multiple sugar transport system substrate-binding protein